MNINPLIAQTICCIDVVNPCQFSSSSLAIALVLVIVTFDL
jgi:hypothetical protein